MSKLLRTLNQLQDCLDAEIAWRLKEIANLKIAVKLTGDMRLEVNTLLRASVLLLYAHWEGFVKNSAHDYLKFVSCQRHMYKDLSSCFIVFGIKKKLDELVNSNKASANILAVDFFFQDISKRANLRVKNAFNTQSNLGSSVFENIAISIGIDPTPYKTKYNLIDKSLLDRRNNIAHGTYLDVSVDDFRKLADEVTTLLKNFKSDIENATSLANYRRSA